jgi:transmembrane sensor
MNIPQQHNDDTADLNEAAAWFAKLRDHGSAATTWVEFTAWLEADSAHHIVFHQIEELYANLDQVQPLLPALAEPDVDVKKTGFALWRAAHPVSIRAGAVGMALASVFFLVVVGLDLSQTANVSTQYVTRTGETRTVTLADGSLIEMNGDSNLNVTLGGTERRVNIDHGEAIFRPAKDTSRPFQVIVAAFEIRDVGTVFNVLHYDRRTVVSVAEGMVAVSAVAPNLGGLRQARIDLKAGDQFVAMQGGEGDVVRHINPALAGAWREGYLTYQDEPLSVVIGDLNRYFPNRIRIEDDATGLRRFSGVLKIDSEDAVINRLVQILHLATHRSGDGSTTLRLSRPEN